MCCLLKTSKCKLIPVQFLPTNITALENISSTNITAQGKYFFPTNITALGKYFNVFRLPAPPQQGSGSQPLAPYFNAIDSINWKPTKIQHKLFFFSFHSGWAAKTCNTSDEWRVTRLGCNSMVAEFKYWECPDGWGYTGRLIASTSLALRAPTRSEFFIFSSKFVAFNSFISCHKFFTLTSGSKMFDCLKFHLSYLILLTKGCDRLDLIM